MRDTAERCHEGCAKSRLFFYHEGHEDHEETTRVGNEMLGFASSAPTYTMVFYINAFSTRSGYLNLTLDGYHVGWARCLCPLKCITLIANPECLDYIMNRKLELLILGSCALLGGVWAVTTHHFPAGGFKLDYLIDLSSLLTVASFSVRGMLPLRVLAVASQIIAIPYFLLQPTPLWTPVGWTILFMAINLYYITRILLERRPVSFSPDEQQLYDLAFQSFAPRDFLKLVKLGQWGTASRGEKILTQGDPITQITVPISGMVSAGQGGEKVAQMAPGELIGAGIALTDQSAVFDAEFAEDARYIRWSVSDINKLLDRNPELSRRFNDVVNRYMIAQINKLALYITGSDRVGSRA